ncbi:Uncharacterised protein [Metamycoplasma arthritidis]|uniref:Uncharacterized protein n=1 Tax=Metamycoplasma arthritidis (strain 158L3-1) TaxID=243272 RepID=B3PN93_META1|nr:hypothetical protein [Metamycoplasma arthritidis]ACF07495.1 hypothetical protein MARTH_orf742 [Metamycoplasma arthritidis 158L3-1]VEU79016.1 Uncharacterised protein [Metamycoplasma arthritidis]
MDLQNIKKIIISTILTISGIAGFASVDGKNKNLDENNIIIEHSNKSEDIVIVKIGLIILSNINAKNIVDEIYQVIVYNLEKNNLKLETLDITIKGTR